MKQLLLFNIRLGLWSPPLRGRGLKLAYGNAGEDASLSPPLRGRGLKPNGQTYNAYEKGVAPLAGAWIETPSFLN